MAQIKNNKMPKLSLSLRFSSFDLMIVVVVLFSVITVPSLCSTTTLSTQAPLQLPVTTAECPHYCVNIDKCKPGFGCTDYQCGPGYTNPPNCNTVCDNLHFGVNCDKDCHCGQAENDTCDALSGQCGSLTCAPGYALAGCQTMLPRLVRPPEVKNVTCQYVRITWGKWDTSRPDNPDVGVGPILKYQAQFRRGESDEGGWFDIIQIPHEASRDVYEATYSSPEIGQSYTFRVLVHYKLGTLSIPGPPGELSPLTPVPPCFVPTSPTTSVTTFTTLAVTTPPSSSSSTLSTTPGPPVTTGPTTSVITSATTSVTTPPPMPVPGRVRNLVITTVSATELGVTWEAPLIDSARGAPDGYEVHYRFIDYVRPRNTTRGTLVVLEVNTTVTNMTLSGLGAFSVFEVSLYAVNIAGKSLPWTKIGRTAEGVASGEVDITQRLQLSDKIALLFSPPYPPAGVITEYEIWYWYTNRGQLTNETKSRSPNSGESSLLEVNSLDPYTLVNVRARARTAVGWGDWGRPFSFRTLETSPGIPAALEQRARTLYTMTIGWSAPTQPNGVITGYTVRYRSDGQNFTERQVGPRVASMILYNLYPYTLYDVQVFASTMAGSGLSLTQLFWTSIALPPSPAHPEVLSFTRTTITLRLTPLRAHRPVTAYQVIVQWTSNRRKRNLPDYHTAQSQGLAEYITGQMVLRDDVRFTVGDQMPYGPYINGPLTPDTTYVIRLRVISSNDGETKNSTSAASAPVTTTVVDPTAGAGTTTSGLTTTTIIIIIVVLLVLVLICLIILFICLKKRKKREGFQMDDTVWMTDTQTKRPWLREYQPRMKENVDRYRDEGEWSDVQEDDDYPNYMALLTTKPPEVLDITELRPNKRLQEQVREGKEFRVQFAQEFSQLPRGQRESWNEGARPENGPKNHCSHLLAYDHTRVVLNVPDAVQGTDYINANYVNGYRDRAAYIAAQSPFNDVTVRDFWQMIWQEDVSAVAMVTDLVDDGILKCQQYWPEQEGDEEQFGEFLVTLVSAQLYAHFAVRTLVVRRGDIRRDFESSGGGAEKTVTQYQFLSWPEHRTPDEAIPFLDFINKVNNGSHPAPLLVHCGSGVGRTGVYIAVHALLRQAEMKNAVNVWKMVKNMRKDRVFMVRTIYQYIFIYDAVLEALFAGGTVYTRDGFKDKYNTLIENNPETNGSYIREQFGTLQNYTSPITVDQCPIALMQVNEDKNRSKAILPPDYCRVEIPSAGDLGRTDYINGVWLDGYVRTNAYIVTQSPMRHTLIDFLAMLWDWDVQMVVNMDSRDQGDNSSVPYWPAHPDDQLEVAPFVVRVLQVTEDSDVTQTTLLVSRDGRAERQIKVVTCNTWPSYKKAPSARGVVLAVKDAVTSGTPQDAPIVFHCRDGASRSGLMAVVCCLCERLDRDGMVDVFHTVRHMKKRRTQIVSDIEQYKMCHKALWDVIRRGGAEGSPGDSLGMTRGATPRLSRQSLDRRHSPSPRRAGRTIQFSSDA